MQNSVPLQRIFFKNKRSVFPVLPENTLGLFKEVYALISFLQVRGNNQGGNGLLHVLLSCEGIEFKVTSGMVLSTSEMAISKIPLPFISKGEVRKGFPGWCF